MTNESSWVERFYSHFLGRDVSYLFAGGLFICVVQYALNNQLNLPDKISLELFGFIVGSYFLGLALSEASWKPLGIVDKDPYPILKDSKDAILLYEKLVKNCHPYTINRLERTNFFMHVGASVGVAAYFGAIFMLGLENCRQKLRLEICSLNFENRLNFTSSYFWIMLGLALYGLFMIWHSRKKNDDHLKELSALANEVAPNYLPNNESRD